MQNALVVLRLKNRRDVSESIETSELVAEHARLLLELQEMSDKEAALRAENERLNERNGLENVKSERNVVDDVIFNWSLRRI